MFYKFQLNPLEIYYVKQTSRHLGAFALKIRRLLNASGGNWHSIDSLLLLNNSLVVNLYPDRQKVFFFFFSESGIK